MTDFVDFTNATELERFTAKLTKKSTEKLDFKGVEFELLNVEERTIQNEFLSSLPHFQFESKNGPGRWFNLGQYKHLHCADRMISEPTGRLLLSSILMSGQAKENSVFLQIGEAAWLGIQQSSEQIILFEAGPVKSFKIEENVQSALSTLKWNISSTLAIKFPKWIGYFHDFCPVGGVEITAIWPKIRPNEQLELLTAPIWTASFSQVLPERRLPMRGQMQRVLLNGHLRDLFAANEASLPALLNVPIFGALNETAEIAAYKQALSTCTGSLIDELFKITGAIYGHEVRRMESEGWSSTGGSGLGPLVWQNMRMTRIAEKISLCWRHFVQIGEKRWEALEAQKVQDNAFACELEEQLRLLDWCIERELEWQESLEKAGFDWKKLLPPLPIFNLAQGKTDLNTEIDRISEEIEKKVALGDSEPIEEDEIELQICEPSLQRLKLLEHSFTGFEKDIWIPLTLNCQPPPPKFTLPPSAPLAGDVVALAQLRSDMAAFKAANPELLQNDSEAFTAFLLWHSPNDVEVVDGRLKVSSRMLDPNGQWQELWREVEAQPLSPQTFRNHVSFNHRSLAGQLLSDWSCKFTLKYLLEAAIPSIIKNMSQKQAELMKTLGIEAEDIKSLLAEVPFPLDKLSEILDAGEAEIAKRFALKQLNLKANIDDDCWLVVDEAERRVLLQQGSFELVFEERIGPDWYYCNEGGGFLARKRTINFTE